MTIAPTRQDSLMNPTDLRRDFVEESRAVNETDLLRLMIPTGHIQEKVLNLLKQIGLSFLSDGRSYRPECSDPAIIAKSLKAQNIPHLVALGRHDCGFSGYDWIVEQQADVVELLDLGFDPVRIIAAMPEELLYKASGETSKRDEKPLVVASEYRRLALQYIENKGLNAVFVQTFGATEALPPEDADIIIDNTATGNTLRHNRLAIADELMRSTTRFICNKNALENPLKRKKLEEMTMLMKSAIRAKDRVLLEMNVPAECFEKLVANLPCMRSPTISPLHNNGGFAIKIAVRSSEVPALIPRLVTLGATDILEYKVEKIVI